MSEPPVLLLHGFGTSFASTWVGNGWTALLEDAYVLAKDFKQCRCTGTKNPLYYD